MSQFSSTPFDAQNPESEGDEPSFVAHPHRHERQPARRQARQRRKHVAKRHERHELVVPGAHLPGTNVPSAPLADELEGHRAAMSPALQRRKARREQRRRKMRRTMLRLGAIATLLFIGQSVVAALSAPQFRIAKLDIVGLKETNAAAVERHAAALEGQNLFRANIRTVEQSVEALPTVKAAHIEREMSWPPRARVIVTERQPVLQVGAGNDWWVVDAEGVAYRRATAADRALYQLTAPQLHPQTNKPLPAKWWQKAFALAKAVQTDNANARKNVGLQLTSTTTSSSNTASVAPFWSLRRLYLDKHGLASVRVSAQGRLKSHGEMLVRLGDDNWTAKLARARDAMHYLERVGHRAEELNLTSLEYPLWKPKPTKENETERT